jgi:hypothetical protein
MQSGGAAEDVRGSFGKTRRFRQALANRMEVTAATTIAVVRLGEKS